MAGGQSDLSSDSVGRGAAVRRAPAGETLIQAVHGGGYMSFHSRETREWNAM
jgi:hypothetical protein